MLKVAAAFVCVWAASWCSRAGGAAAAAAAGAGGRADSGNFLDDKQWLTTISQYDKEVGQWNKFRDVSEAAPASPPPPSHLLLLTWLGAPRPGASSLRRRSSRLSAAA